MTTTKPKEGNEMSTKLTINGIDYIPATSVPTGTRAVVVVDRGWIFAGDVTREYGRIRIGRALHVFRWEGIGFARMVETGEADLRPIADVDMPEGAEIFCVPVADDWGMFCVPVADVPVADDGGMK
jgi:hypothetical protein